jgi:hypothetical protein
MSTITQMSFVGPYQLLNPNGINQTNSNFPAVTTAYDEGRTTNTAGLPFGFFFSAQVCGQAVANWALTRSTAVYATTVGTNGPSVPVDTNGIAAIPAIYAQAYQGGNGRRYVLLTNKSATNSTVEIVQDGEALTNPFLETFVTGSDPSATNAAPSSSAIQIQSQITSNPVTIPEYSVVRLEWTVFPVPAPTLSIASTPTRYILQWEGLTNVVYDLLTSTNLTAWSTLGKFSNTQTNFSVTDPSTGMLGFYRLLVP